MYNSIHMGNYFDTLRKIAQINELPWRDRVEIFGTNRDGKVLGGYYELDKNHGVFGGGVDGEDPAVAAAREFTEESGYPIENVRMLPVEPSVQEWKAPYTSKTQEARAKEFKGSRTLYAAGDIPEGAVPNSAVDPSGLTKIKFRSLITALRQTRPDRAYSYDSALARREAIKHIIMERAQSKSAVDNEYAYSYVPESALPDVLENGLYSSKELLNHPDKLEVLANHRQQDADSIKREIKNKLNGWKSHTVEGPSVSFQPPPNIDALSKNHPLKKSKLALIKINLLKLRQENPDARIHGMELTPRKPDSIPEDRHHDLSDEELKKYMNSTSDDIWKDYSDENDVGYYASNVPHASVITSSGKIDPKYIQMHKSAVSLKFLSKLGPAKVNAAIPKTFEKVGPTLGIGGNNVAKEISAISDGVLRVPKRFAEPNTPINSTFQPVKDIMPGLNIGQTTHVNDQGFEILHRAQGKPAGAIFPRRDVPIDKQVSGYSERMEEIAKLPQGAFDSHFKRLAYIIRKGRNPDPSKPGNFLIDTKNKRINTIDTGPRHDKSSPASLNWMSVPLVDTGFLGSIRNTVDMPRRIQAAIRLTLRKIRNAEKRNPRYNFREIEPGASRPDILSDMKWNDFRKSFLQPYVSPYAQTEAAPSLFTAGSAW